MPNDSHLASSPRIEEEPVQKLKHLLWFCPFVGLLAGTVVLWLYGFSLWAAIVFVLLIVCPLIIVWVLMIDWSQGPTLKGKP
jgi:fatty acid desaturase